MNNSSSYAPFYFPWHEILKLWRAIDLAGGIWGGQLRGDRSFLSIQWTFLAKAIIHQWLVSQTCGPRAGRE